MRNAVIILWVLLTIPLGVSAHTTVKNSTPTEGEVITMELSELSVEFAGTIEDQSTMTLTKENEAQSFETISVEGKKLIGTLTTPLPNGSYTLTWKVAAKDGHIITGDISFTVSIPKTEVAPKEETVNDDVEVETEAEETPVTEEKKEEVSKETEGKNSSPFSTISVIVLIILLSGGIWILFRKKR